MEIEEKRRLDREYYNKNKVLIQLKKRVHQKSRRDRNREFVKDFLSNNPCVDCGESDIVVLEFDHISGKKLHNISEMVGKGSSIKTIDIEISKCEVRCANCHRRVTHNRRIQSIKTS